MGDWPLCHFKNVLLDQLSPWARRAKCGRRFQRYPPGPMVSLGGLAAMDRRCRGKVSMIRAPHREPGHASPARVTLINHPSVATHMSRDRFLACIADPTRFALLRELSAREATVNELVDATGSTQSNVSHHLRLLRDCGFVVFERDGRNNRYSLSVPAIAAFVDVVDRTAEAVAPLACVEGCA